MQPTAPRAPRAGTTTLAAIGLAVSIAPLDSSVNIAFPAITASFGLEVRDIQWVIIGYVLTYSSLVLGFGRLADIVGRRRMLLAGLAWSIVALAMCALVTDFHWFLAARFAQGVGSAMVLSVGPALATLSFPESERTRVVGAYLLGFTAAAAIGPVIGGLVVDQWGWRAVFWYRVPVSVAALIGVLAWVREPGSGASGERFDIVSALTLALGLAGLGVGLARGGHLGWSAPATMALLATGVACSLVFVHRQSRIPHPVLDLGAFRDPAFTAANLAHLAVNAAGFTVMLMVPYYIARSLGMDPRAGGPILALTPLGVVVASSVAARLLPRLGAETVGVGALVLCATGLAGVALFPARAETLHLGSALLAVGFGQGLFQVAVLDRVMATMPRRHHGAAGSLNMVTRTLGVVAGASGGAWLFGAAGGADPERFLAAFAQPFWAGCALVSIAAVGVAVTSRASRRR